jgi:hypothetical protein
VIAEARARRLGKLATRPGRRERMAELLTADPTTSNRRIADGAGSDSKTAAKVRAELERAGAIPSRRLRVQDHGGALLPPAEAGNRRAVKAGQHSEAVIGPVRERHLATLRDRFPDELEALLVIAASRAARVDVLSRYVDQVGLMKRGGEMRGAAVELSRLETALERQLGQLTERAKGRRGSGNGLAAVLAEIAGNGEAA